MNHTAIIFTPPGTVEVSSIPTPDCASTPSGEGEVLVESELSAVSSGTELRVLAGLQPGVPLHRPLVPGYGAVGRVVSRGPLLNRRVVCNGGRLLDPALGRFWGGHQQLHVVQRENLLVLPDDLDARDAALIALAAIAHRGYAVASHLAGPRVLVIGLGIVGQIAARIWSLSGHEVLACDRSSFRVQHLRSSGVCRAATITASLADAVEHQRFDTIVDCTGVPAVITQALPLLREYGTWDAAADPPPLYVVQGSYAGDVSFDYNAAFMRQVLMVFPRDRTPSDTHAVLRLLSDRRLRLADLLTHITDPAHAPALYQQLSSSTGDLLAAAFRWSHL